MGVKKLGAMKTSDLDEYYKELMEKGRGIEITLDDRIRAALTVQRMFRKKLKQKAEVVNQRGFFRANASFAR